MADGTKIEWADATLNYVNGCSLASPGCTNCYAMKQAHRFPVRQGLTTKTKGGMVWTGEVRENPRALEQALKWKRGRAIFWNAHGDLFHESVPDEWIDRQFAVMALTPQHRHMVLTKRAARMREYTTRLHRRADVLDASSHLARDWKEAARAVWHSEEWPLPNVWLGVSVEDQARADERRDDLDATPAAVRFVSYEPALGPVDWTGWEWLDWLISGGESGPKARPGHPEWFRDARDFCGAHAIAYLHKQNGEFAPGEIAGDYLDPERRAKGMSYFNDRWDECWSEPDGHCDDEPDVYRIGKKRAGRLLDGVTHDGVPS